MMEQADADLRVALGLLDLRHLAGDPHLTLRLRSAVLAHWRRTARDRLPGLRALVAKRHDLMGELAHLSVPDLKESEGGLRDATVLKALVATWLVDVPHVDLERSRLALLDVRDALHAAAGRATDRVAPELWGELAERLGLDDEDAAQRHVRELGRRITHLSRLTWRRVDGVLARPAYGGATRRPDLADGRAGSRAGRWRGRADPGRTAGVRPDPAAARGRRRGRARRRAGPGDRDPAGRRGGRPAGPVAERGAAGAGAAARGGARAAAGLGDPRGDRRARRGAAGVGADPAAAARVGDPPVHRRPTRGRDLHGGGGADPPGVTPRRAARRGAAARHRQGRADRAQRRGRAAGAGDRDPDGVRRGRGGARRAAGAAAPAARRDRDDARPRGPGDGSGGRRPARQRRGALAAADPDRGRRPGHLAQGLVDVAGRSGPRGRVPDGAAARGAVGGRRATRRGRRTEGGTTRGGVDPASSPATVERG